ncbi:MAG TPA: arginine repressor [Candidatus Dormibacteraeota bacterium]|nr:arginine repressor [Candidatus Dormibacteraeota bacterium]
MIGEKSHRQRAIMDLVRSRPIHTQEELVNELRRQNHAVTQATVSRDIRELGLHREPGPGGSRYAVGPALGVRGTQVLRDFVSGTAGVQFMAIVHTPPGTANLVAVALDEAAWPEVLGTVAGDDTVMVICTDSRARHRVEQRLRQGGAGAHGADLKVMS